MDIIECVKERKSIRGYKNEPIPKQVIKEILEIAKRSPSGLNTQPWEFIVVAGEVLDNIRKENIEKYNSGIAPDSTLIFKHQGIYRDRQVELAKRLFALMQIKREDAVKREEWLKKGVRFFDAPAAIILTVDKAMGGKFAIFDLGIITQTICLVAWAYGLGTCIEIQGVLYSEVIQRFTALPESKQVIIGIAIGYPDWDFPANQIQSDRETIDNIATFLGFAE